MKKRCYSNEFEVTAAKMANAPDIETKVAAAQHARWNIGVTGVGRSAFKNLAVFLIFVVGIGSIGGACPAFANAETVYVKCRGPVGLWPFGCEWITRSAVVKRLCYDAREKYVIVNLRGTYYHYCEVPASVVGAWRNAESMGHFYNAHVKGRFDCRVLRVPSYEN